MKLYNTMTRSIESFTPTGDEVTLYTCGLTVYSQPHIGNWLPYIYWDVLTRTLRNSGYTVNHTQNYTDVGHLTDDGDNGEDKMEKGARAENMTVWDVAQKYIDIAEHEAFTLLKLQRPTHLIRATGLIDEQISFVRDLEEKGYTYEITDGVYFDTSKLDDYGKLARLDIEGLQAGARVEDTGKRNVTDFALWKKSPSDAQRGMEWDSPWGMGFPGWHLECSVIARETLGDTIDIHCGGIDHIPVHHTNEIAQSESVTGKPFARVWMHNNHIKINGVKLSKSLGNIITLQDIIDQGYDIEAFKLAVLAKHYQTEGNFSWDILEAAQNRLNHWKSVAELRWQCDEVSADTTEVMHHIEAARTALQNNLDTPSALIELESAMKLVEQHPSRDSIDLVFNAVNTLLGIDILALTPDITHEQKTIINERLTARTNKEWAKSDELRDMLAEQGIYVRDQSNRTLWSRSK